MKINHDKKIIDLLKNGITDGVYPGAVLLVAKGGEIVLFKEVGHLSLIPKHIPMRKDTIFDLASLTKPLATTLAIMKLVDEDKVKLDQPLSDLITTSSLLDKKNLTLRLILNHSAGFVDWKPFYLDLVKYEPDERKELLRKWVLEEPLAYKPGEDCVYSDPGFMVLEWVIEERTGMPMDHFIEQNFYKILSLEKTFLSTESNHKRFNRETIAATEDCPWRKRIIHGEVHDENAYAVGGYSGHAGLFGDAREVFAIVNMLRGHYFEERDDYFRPEPETVREFFRRQEIVNNCSWALGWDTPSTQDSSSGRYLSPNSVGHLGFAGTSVWMDLEKDIIIIFLTNRVHPTRNNQKIKAFRPELHDFIMEEMGREDQ